jgi:hypothetical protein
MRAFELPARAFHSVIDGHIIFQGIGPGKIIILSILEAPDYPSRLVLLAGDGLELHRNEAIL